MTERGQQLHATADEQIAELIDLVSTFDETTLRLPCPGREKLGDGTIAANARHTADNYQRIAGFVQTSDRMSSAHAPPRTSFIASLGFSGPLATARQTTPNTAPAPGQHADQYTADTIDLDAVARQLSATRVTLGQIAELNDSQLDAIPPKDSFRFCDGQRTLEQVLASLLTHQSHQVAALRTALA